MRNFLTAIRNTVLFIIIKTRSKTFNTPRSDILVIFLDKKKKRKIISLNFGTTYRDTKNTGNGIKGTKR